MANVVQSPIDIHLRPVAHSSPSLSYNYSSPSSVMSTACQSPHFQPSAFQPITNTLMNSSPVRPPKRRLENDDSQDSTRYRREELMDRSPTPERPKRAPPKRVKTFESESSSKGENQVKSSSSDTTDVDIGVLLGKCTSFSYPPIN